jgi:EAL domain-containing protein (putative c-di-GMP-specific phosphodiesterase class I)
MLPFDSPLFQAAHQLWYGPDLQHIQGRRERRALMLASLAMSVLGLASGSFFLFLGNWPVAALDLVLLLGGLGSAALIWRKQVQPAAVLIFSTMMAVICAIAWIFDVPTPQAPRSTHLFLLPLSVAALMAFRNSGAWLRHGVAALGLLALAFLSVGHGSALTEYALPESLRATGAWVQALAALTILYAMLLVMQNDATIRSILENELQIAIEQDQFELYYQPQFDLRGRVIGAEALIRWFHPQRGLVMPGNFIELAEETGLILPIGQWVLRRACEQLSAWAHQPGCGDFRLAVNISQLQFRQAGFVSQVLGLIDRFGIDPRLLELEITESMLVKDLPDIVQKMSAIRERGVTFSLDDFGTGYSSLNHLKRLPLTQLKIDQSFVRDVLKDANDASIVRTVIALGHNLGLDVIAEGVETQEQHDFLATCGCEFFQGYLFSRPLPIAEFNAFVQGYFQALNPAPQSVSPPA